MNYRNLKFAFLIIFGTWQLISCGQQAFSIKTLLDSTAINSKSRLIVLMETDTFEIVSTYQLFHSNLKSWVQKNDIEDDKILLKIIEKDTAKVLYAAKLIKADSLQSRLNYRIADMLENKQCLIFNKQKKILEKKVIVETFTTESTEGRRIKSFNNYLILETIDAIY